MHTTMFRTTKNNETTSIHSICARISSTNLSDGEGRFTATAPHSWRFLKAKHARFLCCMVAGGNSTYSAQFSLITSIKDRHRDLDGSSSDSSPFLAAFDPVDCNPLHTAVRCQPPFTTSNCWSRESLKRQL